MFDHTDLAAGAEYFRANVLDYSKLRTAAAKNNATRPEEPLGELVAMARANGMVLTFICNMAIPGADYLYEHDGDRTIDGVPTTFRTPPPRRDGAAWPTAPFDETPEEQLWWDHIKRRGFACLHMLREARRAGLPADQIRVELGNEFYHENHHYVLEAFPPDLSYSNASAGG